MKRLNLLLAVVEQGGYLAAGDKAHLAHSAVHRQIKLLEHEVGDKLLTRHGRGVQLTEIGHVLIDLTRRLNAQIAETRLQIDDLRSMRSGILRIGTGTTTLIYFLRQVLDAYRSAHPAIELQVRTGSADEILSGLQASQLDLGLISEPTPPFTPERGVAYHRLYQERFIFVVGPKNPLRLRRRVAWSDLLAESLICLNRGTRVRSAIDQHLARSGHDLRVSMELENEEAIVRMVELGFGVGVISARRLPAPKLHRIALPDGDVVINIAAIFPAGYITRRAKSLLDLCILEAHAQTHAADPRN